MTNVEKQKSCPHERFTSTVNVNRLTKGEGGPITNYSADVRITCLDCGLQFKFMGTPMGFSYSHPSCSFDGTELRVPISPFLISEPQFSNDAYGEKAKKAWEKLH